MQLHTCQHRDGRWTQRWPEGMDSPQTLVLAFGSPELGEPGGVWDELTAAFPHSVLAGCSTAGEIFGDTVHQGSISVAVARFEHTQLLAASTPIADAGDSRAAGLRLARQLGARPGLRAVFIVSDGLHVNGTPLVEGLTAGLPAGVTLTGGLAGDGSRFARTWVLHEGQPHTQRVCAVGLFGPRLRVGHGCDGGWSDFGPERRITRSVGNVLYELDGKPALALYRSYLGDRAAGLPGTALLFPLSVRRDAALGDTLVRTILSIDEAQQSLTFAGDIPQGGVARLMRANTDKLIGSAGVAGQQARADTSPEARPLVISVSCVGRRLVLGERTEEEVETVCEGMSPGSGHIGFYSYGEISPSVSGGASELHNQTMTVTVLDEC